jgi:hypothetical protein
MTAAALQFLFGGQGVPFAANSGIRGYNTASTGAYHGAWPFLDFMKAGLWYTGSDFSGGTPNADNWITGIPNGQHYDFPIVYSMGNETGWFPPGDYEVVCSNTNLTVSCREAGGAVSANTPGAGVCTFTVTPVPGAWGAVSITIRVTNSSGSAQDCTDLRLNLVSERDLLLAGNTIRPVYADAYAGAKSIRMHDIMHFDDASGSSHIRYFSDMRQNLDKRNWAGDGGVGPSGIRNGICPVAVACELADKVGARPWFNVPAGTGQAIYIYDHANDWFAVYGQNSEDASATLIPHRLVNGEKIRSYSFRTNPALGPSLGNDQDMYVINADLNSGKGFRLSATLGGSWVQPASGAPTHSTTADIPSTGVGVLSLTITNIASTTDIVVGSAIHSSHFNGGVGIVSSHSGTSAVLDLVGGDPNLTGSSGTTAAITVNGDLGPTDLAFSVIASLDVDILTDMVNPYLNAIKDYRTAHPTLPAPMLEPMNEIWNFGFPAFRWFQKVASIFAGDFGNHASGTAWFLLTLWKAAEDILGVGNFTLVHPGQGQNFGNLAGSFEWVDTGIRSVGDKVKIQERAAIAGDTSGGIPTVVYAYAMYMANSEAPSGLSGNVFGTAYTDNGNSTAIPDSYWDGKFDNEISFKVGTSASDLASLEAVVPGMLATQYEWGQQVAQSIGNGNEYAVALNYLAYLDGDAGAAMYDRFWQAVVVPNIDRFYTMNHYSGVGGRSLTYAFFAWPILDMRLDETLCKRAAWYKLQ